MISSYRPSIILFVLFTLLLFHFGFNPGAKSAKPENPPGPKPYNRTEPTTAVSLSYSNDLLYRRNDTQNLRAGQDPVRIASELKTEGLFILKREPDAVQAMNNPFDELLLFDLHGVGVSYPAASARGKPEPTESIRF